VIRSISPVQPPIDINKASLGGYSGREELNNQRKVVKEETQSESEPFIAKYVFTYQEFVWWCNNRQLV